MTVALIPLRRGPRFRVEVGDAIPCYDHRAIVAAFQAETGVHRSMEQLQREGLIERRRRVTGEDGVVRIVPLPGGAA